VLTVATAAAGSKIQSAIGAVETAVEAKIPRNCSLGTRQFCVGFSDHTNCTDLSSDISDIIPEAVIVQYLQPLEGIMAKVAPTIIQGSFIFGLGFLAVMTIMFVIVLFKLLFIVSFFLRLGVCLLAVLCFVSFVIPPAILYPVQSEIQSLGSLIGIKKGDVAGKCLGPLVCAGFMMVLTIFMSFFM
jgi:hypothetical protein